MGGTPLAVDELGIDVCYSGSQKVPVGAARLRADHALRPGAGGASKRKTTVPSWYLDLGCTRFWDTEHIYHHTAPVLSVRLRERRRLVLEEGLNARMHRHRLHARALRAGLEAMGMRLFADPAHRLTPVTTVLAPPEVSAAEVRAVLLCDFNIEIAGGLGEYVDRMWRIGVMGHSAQRSNVTLLLSALESALLRRTSSRASRASLPRTRSTAQLSGLPFLDQLANPRRQRHLVDTTPNGASASSMASATSAAADGARLADAPSRRAGSWTGRFEVRHFDVGTSIAVGIRKSMKLALTSWPLSSKCGRFVRRRRYPAHTAVDLASTMVGLIKTPQSWTTT